MTSEVFKRDLRENRPAIMFLGSQMATGGSQKMLLTMGRWFNSRGYPVVVAFLYDREGFQAPWQEEYPLQIHNLQAWRKGDGWRNIINLVKGLCRLRFLMRQENIRVLMTFTHHANLLGIFMAWVIRIPVRIAGHRGVIDQFPGWMERLHAWMVNRQVATCLVAVSERLKNYAIEKEGIHPERIVMIENGIELPKIDAISLERKEAVRQELALSDNDPLILTVGRLNRQKGHTYLLEAFARILVDFPRAVLAIAGEGPLRDDLMQQAQQAGIMHQVRFLGLRSDIPILLEQATVFVFPSLWEGMPVALIEAMAAGLPVVTTRVEGIDELIIDGENGLCVSPAEPEAIFQAICRILGDQELHDRLGSAAANTIQEKFSVDIMCEKYERLFLNSVSSGLW